MPDESNQPTGFFAAGFAEVQALIRAGRWQEALAAGMYLFEQFREEPRACLGLVDTLVALDRSDQAELVLRDVQARFPSETWLSARQATLAAARRDWPQALALWRIAGLPHSSDPAVLRAFALALASAGEATAALRLVQGDAPILCLAQAELLLRHGDVAEAAALWPKIADGLSVIDPDVAVLSGQLAAQADVEAARPILDALLSERDPGTEDWIPAIARALAAASGDDLLHVRIRDVLRDERYDGVAALVAARLVGTAVSSDVLSAVLERALADGRAGLLPLMLETGEVASRTMALRVALRLYLNRAFATEAGIASLWARQAHALMLVARVADPEALAYIANLMRGRFAAPARLDLPHPEDVVGQVAHAQDVAQDIARPAVYVPERMRVAVCVSGRLPAEPSATGLVRALRLHGHDAMVFAHVWQAAGVAGAAASLEAVCRRLPKGLAGAFAEASAAAGMVGLRRLYPGLMQGRAAQETFDRAQVAALLHTDQVTVEDDVRSELAGRSPAWKALYAARQVHRAADATGLAFDLCLHISADAGVAVASDVDWQGVAEDAHRRAVMFADSGYRFDRAEGFAVGHRFAVGSMATMGILAESFALGDQVATAKRRIYGFPAKGAMQHARAMQLHLHGISVEPVPWIAVGAVPELDALSPSAALALLWHDIRARRAASPDSALLHAAMADVTGGVVL